MLTVVMEKEVLMEAERDKCTYMTNYYSKLF